MSSQTARSPASVLRERLKQRNRADLSFGVDTPDSNKSATSIASPVPYASYQTPASPPIHSPAITNTPASPIIRTATSPTIQAPIPSHDQRNTSAVSASATVSDPMPSSSLASFTMLLFLLILAASSALYVWIRQPVAYCDRGVLDAADCQPCPPHAICLNQRMVACDDGYIASHGSCNVCPRFGHCEGGKLLYCRAPFVLESSLDPKCSSKTLDPILDAMTRSIVDVLETRLGEHECSILPSSTPPSLTKDAVVQVAMESARDFQGSLVSEAIQHLSMLLQNSLWLSSHVLQSSQNGKEFSALVGRPSMICSVRRNSFKLLQWLVTDHPLILAALFASGFLAWALRGWAKSRSRRAAEHKFFAKYKIFVLNAVKNGGNAGVAGKDVFQALASECEKDDDVLMLELGKRGVAKLSDRQRRKVWARADVLFAEVVLYLSKTDIRVIPNRAADPKDFRNAQLKSVR